MSVSLCLFLGPPKLSVVGSSCRSIIYHISCLSVYVSVSTGQLCYASCDGNRTKFNLCPIHIVNVGFKLNEHYFSNQSQTFKLTVEALIVDTCFNIYQSQLNFSFTQRHLSVQRILPYCAILREEDCFIDKKTPAALETGWGFTNVIYLGVVSQEGIKLNNPLETGLKLRWLLEIHSTYSSILDMVLTTLNVYYRLY